ncbi:hypothetical protein GCM10027167_88390 [Nocardia heshunensis]
MLLEVTAVVVVVDFTEVVEAGVAVSLLLEHPVNVTAIANAATAVVMAARC